MKLFNMYLDSISNRNFWTNNITKLLMVLSFIGAIYTKNDLIFWLLIIFGIFLCVCLGCKNKIRGE